MWRRPCPCSRSRSKKPSTEKEDFLRIALLGAGIIGRVVARALAHWDRPDQVVVGDLDGGRAAAVAGEHGFESAAVDVRDPASLDAYLAGADAGINSPQYEA